MYIAYIYIYYNIYAYISSSAWTVSLPIATANGESGTVSANNYARGDSAVPRRVIQYKLYNKFYNVSYIIT